MHNAQCTMHNECTIPFAVGLFRSFFGHKIRLVSLLIVWRYYGTFSKYCNTVIDTNIKGSESSITAADGKIEDEKRKPLINAFALTSLISGTRHVPVVSLE